MKIEKLKSLGFSDAGGVEARQRHLYFSLLLSSFGSWLPFSSVVVGFDLDLGSLPTKKSTGVLASCPQSTKMVLLTGGSRKACSIITMTASRSGPLLCTSTPLYFTFVKAHFSVATRTSS
ncbi:unnamed protein product [Brassica rapa subsp. narinosa]